MNSLIYYIAIAAAGSIIYTYLKKAYYYIRDDFRDFSESEAIKEGYKIFPIVIEATEFSKQREVKCSCGHNRFYNPIKYNDSIVACTRCRAHYETDYHNTQEF